MIATADPSTPVGDQRAQVAMRGIHPAAARAAVLAATLLSSMLAPSCGRCATTFVMSEDGAWSWFSDPRAFYEDGVVRTGWVTTYGDIQVGELELAQGRRTVVQLEDGFGSDDHDYPALHQTSDGRYTAFYAAHAVFHTHNLYRTTTYPWDITSWSGRDSTGVNTVGSAGVTYSNPYAIPGETDRIYLMWRGADWKPAYAIGTYDTASCDWGWTLQGRLITVPVGRPYFKCAVGPDRIGIAFTDGHPKEIPCNIYFAAIGKDAEGRPAYLRADGTFIKLLADGALTTGDADLVFDRLANPELCGDNSWVWDLVFDASGAPVVAFASFPSRDHHQYHWARFDGGGWDDRIIAADAGGSVADTTVGNPQYYYSGGITIDPTDPSIVYVSVKNEYGGSDLQRRQLDEQGAWSIEEIAGGNYLDNMRPIVPRGRPANTEMVLWMSGRYDYFMNVLPVATLGSPGEPERYLPSPNGEFGIPARGGDGLYYQTSIKLWVNPASASVDERPASMGPRLHGSRPNPFRDGTEISYELPTPGLVTVRVYDLAGRLVRDLADAEETSGFHSVSWDGLDERGTRAASGIYFVRLVAGGVERTCRCVLVR